MKFDIPKARSLLASLSGEVAYDVGARHGDSSAFLAKRFKKVYAFEPLDESYGKLVALSRQIKNIEPMKVALGSASGQAEVVSIIDSKNELRNVTTLDEVVARTGIPDLVKIDADGAELSILSGAEKTIRAHYPSLYVESQAENSGAIENLLRDWGYEWIRVARRKHVQGENLWYFSMRAIPLSVRARYALRELASSLIHPQG